MSITTWRKNVVEDVKGKFLRAAPGISPSKSIGRVSRNGSGYVRGKLSSRAGAHSMLIKIKYVRISLFRWHIKREAPWGLCVNARSRRDSPVALRYHQLGY